MVWRVFVLQIYGIDRGYLNQDGKDKRINQEHSVARFVGAVLNTPEAYKSEKYFTPARQCH